MYVLIYQSLSLDNTIEDPSCPQVNHIPKKKGLTWGPSTAAQKDKSKTASPNQTQNKSKSPKINHHHRSTSAPNLDSNSSNGMSAWESTESLGESQFNRST